MAELAVYSGQVIDPPGVDEPVFPTVEHQELYRDLVRRMEADAAVLPGMGTAVSLLIRRLARDYVVGVIADQGSTAAASHERDKRMMASFRLLMDQAKRADLEHALRTEFVLGLITECVRVIDGSVDDQVLRVQLKERMSGAFISYVDRVAGRITN